MNPTQQHLESSLFDGYLPLRANPGAGLGQSIRVINVDIPPIILNPLDHIELDVLSEGLTLISVLVVQPSQLHLTNKLQQRSLESINLQSDWADLLLITQKQVMRREGTDKNARVVEILMAEAEENKRIDQARALQARDTRQVYSEEGDRNMRNITEKLNRLEKTLLKKGQCNENYTHLSTAKKDKYAELNHLNDQLRRTLAKITGGKGGINAEEIQKKVISLYNNSVATLNSQDRLNKQLSIVEEKRDGIDKEIKEARTELERGKVELENIVAMRQLSLRRLERLLP